MMRFFAFILKIAALAAIVLWLADRPGTAHIVWHDQVIETSAAFLALCVLGLAFIVHLLWRAWHFLRHGPAHWRMRRKLDKMRQGHAQLAQGLIAIASGHAGEAGRLAIASRKNSGALADAPVFSLWLQAQAAQLAGDNRAAREIFRTLAAHPDAAILGYRGLITEARRAGQWDEVERLIAELHARKPALPWLSLIRMESAARKRRWDEAESALSHAVAGRLLAPDEGRGKRAALRIAASRDAASNDEALKAAEQAAQQAPNWLPAMINLAAILSKGGHRRAASRVIERAWKRQPHPELAQIAIRQAEDAMDGFRQTERFCKANPGAVESRIALAEAALAADIWGEARRHLVAAVADGVATRKVYKLLARLERREHGDEKAAVSWLLKAAEAPVDDAWICQDCGEVEQDWQPVCNHCRTFGSIDWLKPGARRTALPMIGGMAGHD